MLIGAWLEGFRGGEWEWEWEWELCVQKYTDFDTKIPSNTSYIQSHIFERYKYGSTPFSFLYPCDWVKKAELPSILLQKQKRSWITAEGVLGWKISELGMTIKVIMCVWNYTTMTLILQN